MDGPTLLRKWLDLDGYGSRRRLAGWLGVGESAVWAWLQGRTRPGLDMALALERLSEGGVPATAWANPDTQEEIDTRRADSSGA